MRAAFEGVTVRDVMTPAERVTTVDPETSVSELIQTMFRERHTGYPVAVGDDVVGLVTLDDDAGRPRRRTRRLPRQGRHDHRAVHRLARRRRDDGAHRTRRQRGRSSASSSTRTTGSSACSPAPTS